MNRTPQAIFADLMDALTRMTVLNAEMQTAPVEDVDLVTKWDAQADRAMAAHAEFVIQADALSDIEALLETTYGGVPS